MDKYGIMKQPCNNPFDKQGNDQWRVPCVLNEKK